MAETTVRTDAINSGWYTLYQRRNTLCFQLSLSEKTSIVRDSTFSALEAGAMRCKHTASDFSPELQLPMPLEHGDCEFDPALLYDTCACFSVLCCSVQVVPYCSDFCRTQREQDAAHPATVLYTLYTSFRNCDVEQLCCRSWLSHKASTTLLPIITLVNKI